MVPRRVHVPYGGAPVLVRLVRPLRPQVGETPLQLCELSDPARGALPEDKARSRQMLLKTDNPLITVALCSTRVSNCGGSASADQAQRRAPNLNPEWT